MDFPITYNSPALESELSEARKLLSYAGPLPAQLCEVWQHSNGYLANDMVFYSTEDIVERNSTLESSTYCPGYIVIANDNGSRIALLNFQGNSNNVFLSYMGTMKIPDMVDTGQCLKEWIESRCPFDLNVYPEISAVEPVYLQLDQVPPGGLKALLQIKKLTDLEIGITDLKERSRNLPMKLSSTTYSIALRIAAEINSDNQYVSIWSRDEPSKSMPLKKPYH